MKVGFFSLLTVLFIGLKLAEIISWSWFWVMAPLFIPLATIIGVPLMIWCLAWVIQYCIYGYQYMNKKWRDFNER